MCDKLFDFSSSLSFYNMIHLMSLYMTRVNTGAIAPVCTYFLNMHDIILVVDDIVMLLS